ncbi:MAG: tetratricopeptide repeat protein, partial [Anaerolineae bacterium]|nr:tetratricopeptide repeat protein [Anaerolineae bacterium]
ALALQQELNNRLGTARVLWSMGGIAFEQHRYAEALTYAQEAGAIYEAIGDLWGTATLAGNMALLSQAQGDFASALAYNQQDLDYDLETGNRHGESVALGNRGWILLDSGRLDEALDCYQHAVDIQEALGNKWEVARHRASIAEIWVRRHEPRHALSEFQRAIPVLRDHGAVFYLIDPLLGAANLLIDLGDLAAAREFLNEAGAIAAELGLADRLLQYHILEARLDHAAGDTQCALERLREMDRQATEPQQQATVLYWRWRLGGEDDDRTAAEDLYAKLCRRIPKFDYTMRLEELRDQTTGSENLFE